MQQIVSTSAGETLVFEVDRGGLQVDAQGHAGAEGNQGQVRQCASAGHSRHHPIAFAGGYAFSAGRAFQSGRARGAENLVRGRAHAFLYRGRHLGSRSRGPTRWPDSNSSGLRVRWRRKGLPSLFSLAAVLSVSIGLLNLFPGAAARWRPPLVLRNRSGQGRAAIGARSGGRVSHRARDRRDADDLRNLQRHSASRRPMDGIVGSTSWGVRGARARGG